MFSEISTALKARMQELETRDLQDRTDGTPRNQRLRQISYETGQFLSVLAINLPKGEIIEIGTSAGYSTVWLAFAAKETGRTIKTFELDADKIEMAKKTFQIAGLNDVIELVHGDFLDHVDQLGPVAFCFLDAEKQIYERCFKAVAPKIVKNGLIVADNATDHYEAIKPMIDHALQDDRFDCLTVPIGNGEFISRRK